MVSQLNTPSQTTQLAVDSAVRKTSLPFSKTLFLAILAGAYVALGGATSVIIGYGFPEITTANPSLQRFLSGATFPIGLILVVFLGAELFTGNNALLLTAMLSKKMNAGTVLANWALVWVGNFIGTLLFIALFIVIGGAFNSEPYCSAIRNVALAKTSLPWLTVFVRGIGANWLVCLAVWLALTSNSASGKIAGCWFPVMAFVALGFEHAIANMFFIPAGIAVGADISLSTMIFSNLIPATLGNIVGGALFVGAPAFFLHPPVKK